MVGCFSVVRVNGTVQNFAFLSLNLMCITVLSAVQMILGVVAPSNQGSVLSVVVTMTRGARARARRQDRIAFSRLC